MKEKINLTVVFIFVATMFMIFGQTAQSILYSSIIGWFGYLTCIIMAIFFAIRQGKNTE